MRNRKTLTVLVIFFFIVLLFWQSGCGPLQSEPVSPSVLGDLSFAEGCNESKYTVYIFEKDALTPYLVLTDNYLGTGNCLLLRKCILQDLSIFNPNIRYSGYYENSVVDQLLNTHFLECFSADFVGLISETEIPITHRDSLHANGDAVTRITRKIFLLSATEAGRGHSRTILTEGSPLEYFDCDERRICLDENEEPSSWWLRTPCAWYDNVVCSIGINGVIGFGGVGSFGGEEYESGVRPAFCISSDVSVELSKEGFYILSPDSH